MVGVVMMLVPVHANLAWLALSFQRCYAHRHGRREVLELGSQDPVLWGLQDFYGSVVSKSPRTGERFLPILDIPFHNGHQLVQSSRPFPLLSLEPQGVAVTYPMDKSGRRNWVCTAQPLPSLLPLLKVDRLLAPPRPDAG